MQITSYRKELYRKTIHLSSLWIPAAVWCLDKVQALWFLALGLFLVVLFEIFRRNDGRFGQFLNKLFKDVLRQSESGKHGALTGALYMFIASLVVTATMQRTIAVTALSVLIVSDSLAALIGKKFGKIRIGTKSLEGSVAFFISAVIIVIFFAYIDHNMSWKFIVAGIIASLITTIVELYATKLKIDDNLLIPLIFAMLQSGVFLTFC